MPGYTPKPNPAQQKAKAEEDAVTLVEQTIEETQETESEAAEAENKRLLDLLKQNMLATRISENPPSKLLDDKDTVLQLRDQKAIISIDDVEAEVKNPQGPPKKVAPEAKPATTVAKPAESPTKAASKPKTVVEPGISQKALVDLLNTSNSTLLEAFIDVVGNVTGELAKLVDDKTNTLDNQIEELKKSRFGSTAIKKITDRIDEVENKIDNLTSMLEELSKKVSDINDPKLLKYTYVPANASNDNSNLECAASPETVEVVEDLEIPSLEEPLELPEVSEVDEPTEEAAEPVEDSVEETVEEEVPEEATEVEEEVEEVGISVDTDQKELSVTNKIGPEAQAQIEAWLNIDYGSGDRTVENFANLTSGCFKETGMFPDITAKDVIEFCYFKGYVNPDGTIGN